MTGCGCGGQCDCGGCGDGPATTEQDSNFIGFVDIVYPPYKVERIEYNPAGDDTITERVRELTDRLVLQGWHGVGVINSTATNSLYVVFERN